MYSMFWACTWTKMCIRLCDLRNHLIMFKEVDMPERATCLYRTDCVRTLMNLCLRCSRSCTLSRTRSSAAFVQLKCHSLVLHCFANQAVIILRRLANRNNVCVRLRRFFAERDPLSLALCRTLRKYKHCVCVWKHRQMLKCLIVLHEVLHSSQTLSSCSMCVGVCYVDSLDVFAWYLAVTPSAYVGLSFETQCSTSREMHSQMYSKLTWMAMVCIANGVFVSICWQHVTGIDIV